MIPPVGGLMSVRNQGKIAHKVNEPRPATNTAGGGVPGSQWFAAIITGHTSIISNRRWSYSWTQAKFDHSDSKLKSGGDSATYLTGTDNAYNIAESLQQSSGTYDRAGVTHTHITDAGFLLLPIANDVVVFMFATVKTDGNPVYLFSMPNDDDGTCA